MYSHMSMRNNARLGRFVTSFKMAAWQIYAEAMSGIFREDAMRVRTHYELHVPENYHGTNSPKRIIDVDTQDKDDVYYLFHVYLDDPDTQIFVCYHDGTKKRLILE